MEKEDELWQELNLGLDVTLDSRYSRQTDISSGLVGTTSTFEFSSGLDRDSSSPKKNLKTSRKRKKHCFVNCIDNYGIYILLLVCGLLLYISKLLWDISLQGCSGDIVECLIKMQHTFDQMMSTVVLFSIIHFTIFLMGVHIKNKLMKTLGIGIPTGTFFYLYYTCRGFTWEDHSQANFLLCQAVWVFLFTVYFLIRLNIYLYKNHKRVFRLWITFFSLLFLVFLWKRVLHSCGGMYEGLNSSDQYSESGNECQWNKSGICWHYTVDRMFAPLFWFRSDCAKEETKLNYYEDKAKKTRIIAFPNPVLMDTDTLVHFEMLQKATISSSLEVTEDAIKDPRNRYEAFLDLREKGNEKLIINLKSLKDTEEGKKFLPHNQEHMNILQIFVDTVSRGGFHRRFSKMKQFLKQYHHSEGKNKRVYEFFRHHSIRGYTSPNLIGVTYGNYNDAYDQKEIRIDTFARENGYVTGMTNDMCNAIEVERKGRVHA